MPLSTPAKNTIFRILRFGFRLAPMPVAMRDRLRQRFLDQHHDFVPHGPRGQTPIVSALENRPRTNASGRAIGFRDRNDRAAELPTQLPASLIAFYLPQFHPIPENDAWWGEGFTEWHNVTRALPQFAGHMQPRLPGTLGFYDLREPSVMRKQMQLASEYGISAFCMYFYWFAGRTLLESPVRRWLDDSTLQFPICLCWANENWSRRWDGRADQILIGQQHSAEDDLAFIAHVAPYLADPRYLRVGGKPLLLVYRPGLLPNPKATAARWRAWCEEHGVGAIYLAYVQSFDRVDPRDIGFDGAVAFPPNNTTTAPITADLQLFNPAFEGDVYDWRTMAKQCMDPPDPGYALFPCVNPGWDNEPRRSGTGRVFLHASPRGYRDWLAKAIDISRKRTPLSPLVFINAWNEWAEGAVLEPDARLGHAWLSATRNAVALAASINKPSSSKPVAIIHAWYLEPLDEIARALHDSDVDWRIVITTAPERANAVRESVQRLHLDAEIVVYENRGRDILPFLLVADRLLDEGVDIVLKLHTKRSTHRADGDSWRRELVQGLLSREVAAHALRALRDDPSLGLIAPQGHLQPLHYFWGANETNVRYLASRLGVSPPSPEQDTFIAGSMFWLRLSAIRSLLDAGIGLWEFEDESGQVDGTLAHAVERVFSLAAVRDGFNVSDTGTLQGVPAQNTGPYPYARRDA